MIFNNKRSETEIIGQILSLAKKDAKKTHLMYRTNLCYNHFVEYMNFLLKKNFLAEKKGKPVGNIYCTTEKGCDLLDNINNILQKTK